MSSDMQTPYAGAAGVFLLVTIGKLKSSRLSEHHLHMEYISLNRYDIPELVVPIRVSLIEGCC